MRSGSCCGGTTWRRWRPRRSRCCCCCGSSPPRCCAASRARPGVSLSGRRGARAGGEASATVPFVVGLGQTFPRAPPGVRRGGAGAGPGSRGGRGRAHGRDGPGGGREPARARSPPKLLLLAPLSCKKGAQEKEASPPCSLGTYPAGGTRRFSLRAGSGERAELQKERQKSPTPLPAPLPSFRGPGQGFLWSSEGSVSGVAQTLGRAGEGVGGRRVWCVCPVFPPLAPAPVGGCRRAAAVALRRRDRGTRRAGVRPSPARPRGRCPNCSPGAPSRARSLPFALPWLSRF